MKRRIFLALALWLACFPAWAAVAFQAKGTGACNVASNVGTCTTLTIPGGGTKVALAVVVAYTGPSIVTAATTTWGGTAMTLVTGTPSFSVNHSGTVMFCLAAPATGAQTLSVNLSAPAGITEIHMIGASFTGVDQATPCRNGVSATPATSGGAVGSITVTSAIGNIPVAVFSQGDASDISTNGTTIVIDDSGPSVGITSNYNTGAATVAMTTTPGSGAVKWGISGLDLLADSGGGGAVLHQRTLTGVGQ